MVVGLPGKGTKKLSYFSKNKVFVVAEMANSHEGDLSRAKKITEKASLAGANAIKFQKFYAEDEVERHHKNYNLLKNLEMKDEEWKELITFAKKKNLKVFVDVDGLRSAKAISPLNVDGYKIHASDLNNPFLLEFLSNEKKPILVSSAGSSLNEIEEAVNVLQKIPKEIVIMHGYQGYPTKINEQNLKRISKFKKRYDFPVGIMDHVDGSSKLAKIIPLLGISLGARVIEKHITLDRSKKGIDYFSALNPDEFKEMVDLIKMTNNCLGTGSFKLSPNELEYRFSHKKNTIAKNSIKKRTKLHDKLFEFKITKNKQYSVPFYEYRGRKSSSNIPKGAIIKSSMLGRESKKIAAVIACRVESSRLFAKPIQSIGDYTILEFLVKQIQKSSKINDIVLAISEKPGNEIFVKFAREKKLKYILGDDIDVLKRLIDGAKHVNADIVFRVTSENPYIYWEAIDSTITKHIQGNFDYSTVLPLPLGSSFEIINRKALEISYKFGKKRHRSEHADLYIFENKKRFKINVVKPEKDMQKPELRLTVDTPQDLILAQIIFQALGKKGTLIHLKKIIKFLEENQHLAEINTNIEMAKGYAKIISNLLKDGKVKH